MGVRVLSAYSAAGQLELLDVDIQMMGTKNTQSDSEVDIAFECLV